MSSKVKLSSRTQFNLHLILDVLPNDFKMVFHGVKIPTKLRLPDVIISCPNTNEFPRILQEIASSDLIFICNHDTLVEVTSSLLNYVNLHTVFLLTDQKDPAWSAELKNRQIQLVSVHDER